MSPETPLELPYNLSGQMGIEVEEGGPLQTHREAPSATKTLHMATTGPLKQACPLRSLQPRSHLILLPNTFNPLY